MKGHALRCRKLYIWLLADLTLLAAYFLLRGCRGLMNALADHVTGPLRRALGGLCYRTDISVMEVLYTLAGLLAAVYAVWTVIAVCRSGSRGRRAYSGVLGAVCALLSVYAAFCLLWGVDYWTDSFQDRSGIRARPVELGELRSVTAYFARQLSAAADGVVRNGEGVTATPLEEILTGSTEVYDRAEQLFPFLAFEDRGVKPMAYSRLMSIMGFTGVYCPFTGESNLNVDTPACLLPSTVAHELAHQRGVASEQECNFLAVLASVTCADPAYQYAGWMMGYIHLGNALYAADPETYWVIRDALPDEVAADLAHNNAYWAQFQDSAVQRASNKFYDGVLKAYGDEAGIQSYGTVVDLLVVYYREQAEA